MLPKKDLHCILPVVVFLSTNDYFVCFCLFWTSALKIIVYFYDRNIFHSICLVDMISPDKRMKKIDNLIPDRKKLSNFPTCKSNFVSDASSYA